MMGKSDYNHLDLKRAYRELGLNNFPVVMVRSDLRCLGRYSDMSREGLPKAHFEAMAEAMDPNSTLIVSTASTSLCNTQIPFDINNTPSEMGIFSEYVRNIPGAVRSFHPFISWTALGPEAKSICCDISRHGFGLETPKARMIEKNALMVSIGANPRTTCTTVHHVEFIMGVPYRYVKEFMHPVIRNDAVLIEPFYLYVWYRGMDFKRDTNRKIFKRFLDEGNRISLQSVGRGAIYAYSMRDFYISTVKAFREDIYIWLQEPPSQRPYQT
jgi:aminoglycoside 3-N-acetyltransferase